MWRPLKKWFQKSNPAPKPNDAKTPKIEFLGPPSFWVSITLVGAVLLHLFGKFINWFGQTKSPKGRLDVEDVLAALRAGISMGLVITLAKLLEGVLPYIDSWFWYIVLAVIVTLAKKLVATSL